MTHPLLQGLNPAQAAIVSAPDHSIMVLAGAGSGKTRVLIHRIAWLNQNEGVPTHGILAVTFTNKAAGEMRRRLEAMGMALQGMWVGTFHGLAHRWLRLHFEEAGLAESFQVMDSDDQLRLIKRVMIDLEVDPDLVSPRDIMDWINQHKDEGYRARDVPVDNGVDREMVRIYSEYEERCRISDLVDFAELLLRTHEMFGAHPALLAQYQRKFGHLLVDEFQDTNALQYQLVKRLAGPSGKVLAVGDDSQSIYGWRGARVENVQKFLDEFAGAELMRLEQNYRSFSAVLVAANALIANNPSQIKKSLWTARKDEEPIRLHTATDEVDEARYVVGQVSQHVRLGGKVTDCAILYRNNAMSRPFEEALIQAKLPYKITGGVRFFERVEIKDAMAYLRLTVSRNDDTAFERVANTPTRGMGEKTLAQIRERARAERICAWEASHRLMAENALPKRAAAALRAFHDAVETVERSMASLPAEDLGGRIKAMIHVSGLREYHGKESKNEADRNRVENLDELVNVAARFVADENAPAHPLLAFLTHVALEASEAAQQEKGPAVELMTLHSAKGLEFKLVFLVGMEEGLFPSERSVTDPDRRKLEEERRLAYVGITRAEQRLTLTHAHARRLYGQLRMNPISRFLAEVPRELLRLSQSPGVPGHAAPFGRTEPRAAADLAEPGTDRAPPPAWPTAPGQAWRPGTRVAHAQWGSGLVVKLQGDQVQVVFRQGAKWVGAADLATA